MIQITADTRRAVVTNKELLTVGSAGIQVEFTLSEDWAGLSKLAVFRVGDEGRKVDVALGIDLTCVVPPEVLTEEGEVLFIGIYGANGSGSIIIPTVWASAGVVKPGTEPNTPAAEEPTPEIWAQILGVATDAEQTAGDAMSNVEAGLQELSGLENTVQNAEDQRQANELVRIANETDRVAAETERSSAENSREVSETERLGNETTRQNNETARATAETARASAETERASAEQTRKVNENTRKNNENTRKSNETMRTRQETLRQEHEASRMSAETARNGAENVRLWNDANFLRDGVSATTLPAGSDATVSTTWITNPSTGGTGTVGSIAFGIPQGEPGTTDAGDIEYDDTETYDDGTVGKALTDQKNAISQLREISILFIGNSLTQDGIAYLPYMLKTFYPDIKFKFYIYYNGGFDLAQTYQHFLNDGACSIFSVAENEAAWTNYNSIVKMSDVLSTYTFDIVCMQEYFNSKTSYTSTTDWDNCQKYIQAHYTGGNGLEFISLFHAPKRSDLASVYDLTESGNLMILRNTAAQDMIPNGIAVYKACFTALDSLGDQGHLSPDGTHTQEGLPCLLQTYVSLLWIFSHLSINKSVYGLSFKMTTAIYNTLNVPGPNLGTGVIEGTDAENLLAQEVAIQAYKSGIGLVELAMMPMKIVSISATFTQGSNVIYTFDTLDYLRQFLVVTATFTDGLSEPISDYILSGTLEVGTSTITVNADGKTATFNVTVNQSPFETATYENKRIYRYATTGQYAQYVAVDNTQSNNMALTQPLTNENFLITVTDPSVYDVLVYNITGTTYTAGGYPGVDNGKAWVKSDYSISSYLMFRVRKVDDSAFSEDEVANLYGTVFTVSRRTV